MNNLLIELLKKRIYVATAIIIMLIAIRTRGYFEFNFNQSISIISSVIIISIIGMIFLLFGSIEWNLEKNGTPINNKTKWLHYIITLVLLSILLVMVYKNGDLRSNSHPINKEKMTNNIFLLNSALYSLLFVQIIFVFGVFKALFKIKR